MKKLRDIGLVILAYLLIYGGAYVKAAEVLQISTDDKRLVLLSAKCSTIGQKYIELQQPTQHIISQGCWIFKNGWYILEPQHKKFVMYYPKPN